MSTDLSAAVGELQAGPRNPSATTPLLPPGAIRRTSHVEVGPRGAAWGEDGVALEVRGAVRDVRADGVVPTLLGEACMVADLDADRRLERVVLEPPADTSGLVGAPVGGGFRSGALAVLDDPSSPRGVLLRDLPTAVVILAGYAHLRTLQRRGVPSSTMTPPRVLPSMADVCSGWRSGGVMTSSIARGDGVPLQDCPAAPDLGAGWHDLDDLPDAWARRRRRIDLMPSAGGYRVDAMFRDSYAAPDEGEQVLHEYGLVADLDDDLVLTRVVAEPRVLPFTECPWAADSVAHLAGTRAADVRAGVAEYLSGRAGCTHMNDLVAALADLPALKP